MRALAIVCVLVAACKARPAVRDAAPVGDPGALRGTFALTYYWVADAGETPGRATVKLHDRDCGALAEVSAGFADAIEIAGTGRLGDGRTLGVAACRCAKKPCFRVLDHAWGVGTDNRPLEPFRSLAVDRDVIPIGTRLWIAELAGVDMPGTFPMLHDGCVVADDVGGRIDGNRIDFFVGTKLAYQEINAAVKLERVTVHDGGARCDPSGAKPANAGERD